MQWNADSLSFLLYTTFWVALKRMSVTNWAYFRHQKDPGKQETLQR